MKLFEAGLIGKLEIKNRLVMLPMGMHYANKQGLVNDRVKDYYAARAEGGAGLVIVEVTSVDSPVGNILSNQLVIDDDKCIPGMSELARVIKQKGARAAIQIGHAGNSARTIITGQQPVAPSAVKRPGLFEIPIELTIAEIQNIVGRFAKAAERARISGFDAVEIHAAHNYLVNQFLSAEWNKRQDIYGGELENRVRFLLEILTAVRQAVGQDFPVWCRINAEEYGMKDGITLAKAKETARMIEDKVDAISVSATGLKATALLRTSPEYPGALLPLARGIKDVVKVPIIAAGRITPEIADKAIQEGAADFIGIGRGLICDPALPHKLEKGETNEIRPCICCYNCYSDLGPATCSVNAAAGKERDFAIRLSNSLKKVLIVGAGPSGMEAARVAALRGHNVTIFDENARLGGQLILAAIPPGKKDKIEPLINYYATQIQKLGIRLELQKEVTVESISKEKPDVVILATGVVPFIPDIPGVNRPNVVKAIDVLAGKEKVGARAVIIGGELVGCETADFLAGNGRKIVIVRRGQRMADKMHMGPRRSLIDRLRDKSVTMFTEVKYDEIVDSGLVIINKEGTRQLIEADNIILASGARSKIGLLNALKENEVNFKIFSVGDCVKPGGIIDAISDGFHIAFAI